MSSTDDDYEDDDTGVQAPLTARFKRTFWPPPAPRPGDPDGPDRTPPDERKAAMGLLDWRETRMSFVGFLLGAIFGIALPIYFIVEHVITKTGKHRVTVGPDALLLGGVILLCSVFGFFVLAGDAGWIRRRRRTLAAFLLFIAGLAVAGSIFIVGMIFIFLGGWLLLNAWRINRYGTSNAKAIRQEVATRPRGKGAASTTKGTTKRKPSEPGARKPPTASKRYTPKSPARKKIPKPTQ